MSLHIFTYNKQWKAVCSAELIELSFAFGTRMNSLFNISQPRASHLHRYFLTQAFVLSRKPRDTTMDRELLHANSAERTSRGGTRQHILSRNACSSLINQRTQFIPAHPASPQVSCQCVPAQARSDTCTASSCPSPKGTPLPNCLSFNAFHKNLCKVKRSPPSPNTAPTVNQLRAVLC